MVSRRTPFRQTDIIRAVKALKAAGLEVACIEFQVDARIVIIFTQKAGGASQETQELDRELAEFEVRHNES